MKVTFYTQQGQHEWVVDALTLPTASGQVCIYEGHEPSIWRLVEGDVVGERAQHSKKNMLSAGGIVYVHDQGVDISIDVPVQRG